MGTQLVQPVHLYVKTHRITGLKYFGRTTAPPHEYLGSGTYWKRHVARYGNSVHTQIIGTYTDSNELTAAARAFSKAHNIAENAEWANLLPEDGGISGEDWDPLHDYSAKVAALDRAVQHRLAQRRSSSDDQETEVPKPKDHFGRTFAICLILASIAGGIYFQSSNSSTDGYADGYEFFFGALMTAVTPIGWILAGLSAWIVNKLTTP